MLLTFADEYDTSALISVKKPTFIQKLLVRASFPIFVPILAYKFLTTKFSTNPLHDGKRDFSGKRVIESCKPYQLNDIKACSKGLKLTINDLLTSCLTTAVKQYFELKGDTKSDQINLAMPFNIRFQHYENPQSVVLENKIAAVPLSLHLKNDIKESLKEVPKEIKRFKTSMGEVYAIYILSLAYINFVPYFLV
jgi:NRPS condensation-like uncharacterized protein